MTTSSRLYMYRGGVRRYDFSAVFDDNLFEGDIGLFRVTKEFGFVRLLDVPLRIQCDKDLDPTRNRLRTIYARYQEIQPLLHPLLQGFDGSKMKQICGFSLGGVALGGHPKPAIDGQLKTGHRK